MVLCDFYNSTRYYGEVIMFLETLLQIPHLGFAPGPHSKQPEFCFPLWKKFIPTPMMTMFQNVPGT